MRPDGGARRLALPLALQKTRGEELKEVKWSCINHCRFDWRGRRYIGWDWGCVGEEEGYRVNWCYLSKRGLILLSSEVEDMGKRTITFEEIQREITK